MVEGNYKTICHFHPNVKSSSFFNDNKTVKERQYLSSITMKNILEASGGLIKQILSINECCIMKCESKNDFDLFFKHLNMFTPYQSFNDLKMVKNSFNFDHFKDINPQSAIISPLITPINFCFIEKSDQGKIQKFDLNQAYLSVLCCKKLTFPTGQGKKLVGIEGELFFSKNILKGKQYFSICKVLILPSVQNNELKTLPFFPYKYTKDNEEFSTLTTCKMCCFNQSKTICKHTEEERSFVIECTSDDLIYAIQMLGYKCRILSILYFDEQMHFDKLCSISKHLYDQRKHSKCKAENFFIKQIILRGLGRFALQTENCLSKTRQIMTHFELENALLNGQLNHYNVLEDICFANFKPCSKQFNYGDLYKKSVRNNCCSIVFSKISNQIRRNMHQISLQFLKLSNVYVLRIDVDSILIRTLKTNYDIKIVSDILNSIEGLEFKIELDDISQYISIKKRCYALQTKFGPLLKCPGLKMSYEKRCSLDIQSIIKKNLDNVSI